MRVFVTGSGGHIGSAVVAELIEAGHEVVGLVRSEASADAVAALGAEPLRGDVNDVALLRTTAEAVDAVSHLAFDNVAAATGGVGAAADADRLVVRAFADALEGSDKAFIGIGMGRTGDEELDRRLEQNPRTFVSREVAEFAARGIRSILIAIPPVTHSDRDTHGFVPMLIDIARRTGVSGYIDEGQNLWPAVHTLDLAHLYRLALENAPAGAQLIGAAEPGIPVRDIAESIARHLGVPAASIPADTAAEHFAPFPFMGMDVTMPNEQTRALLDWDPTHLTLLEEIDSGHYFA
ncbi:SDR family oxidoreductase [Gryllotalpicola koreensis]|uniref:SDR family oxidoreductase n=1 Tax=Gryllotalpicola koreensis TaxID=993086 RepID=A0ABP8A463_9MICO